MGNLFISGDIGVGKSYLLRNILEELDVSLGGFVTGKGQDVSGHWVYLMSLNDCVSSTQVAYVKNGENIYQGQVFNDRFDAFGTLVIREAIDQRQLIVMDEIGVMERQAETFKKCILEALDSEKPVIGIVKNRKDSFLERVKAREDTKVLFLTDTNAVEVKETAKRWLKDQEINFKGRQAHVWRQKRIDMYERALSYPGTTYPGVLLETILSQTANLGDKKWLDLGAGTGAFSLPLANRSASVDCLDASFNMLMNLSRKVHERKMTNIRGFSVPFPEFARTCKKKSYDYVLSSFSGGALKDKENLMRFVDLAMEKAFIMSAPKKRFHNFNGQDLEQRLNRPVKAFKSNAQQMQDYLTEEGCVFDYEELTFQFPQVFNTYEECFAFFKGSFQIEKQEEKVLKEFILENLREEERFYIFDNQRTAGLLTVHLK